MKFVVTWDREEGSSATSDPREAVRWVADRLPLDLETPLIEVVSDAPGVLTEVWGLEALLACARGWGA